MGAVADRSPPGEVTDDAFLGGALAILQPRRGYRAGLDAVMLAAAVAASGTRAPRVLDLGAGVGTAGLCVARRVPHAEVVLLERAPQLAALAAENIARNGLGDRVRVVNAEIGAPALALRAAGVDDESFTHVIANPPYHDSDAGTTAPDAGKAASHAMPDTEIERWARFAARMSMPRGEVVMIHKAEALPRLLGALEPRFGTLRVLPLHPRAGDPAHRVIVSGTKASRAPLQLLAGFVLHGEGHAFTQAAQRILKDGAALDIEPSSPSAPG